MIPLSFKPTSSIRTAKNALSHQLLSISKTWNYKDGGGFSPTKNRLSVRKIQLDWQTVIQFAEVSIASIARCLGHTFLSAGNLISFLSCSATINIYLFVSFFYFYQSLKSKSLPNDPAHADRSVPTNL